MALPNAAALIDVPARLQLASVVGAVRRNWLSVVIAMLAGAAIALIGCTEIHVLTGLGFKATNSTLPGIQSASSKSEDELQSLIVELAVPALMLGLLMFLTGHRNASAHMFRLGGVVLMVIAFGSIVA